MARLRDLSRTVETRPKVRHYGQWSGDAEVTTILSEVSPRLCALGPILFARLAQPH